MAWMISEIASSPGIRFLKPDAAGIEQQQHGAEAALSGAVAGGPQQAHELRAMDFAERAAEKPAVLRRHEDLLAIKAAAAHHDAVIERACEVELGKVRAHGALLRPKKLDEALGVEQPGDALAGRGLVPIRW